MILSAIVIGCTSGPTADQSSAGSYANLSAKELKQMMEKKDFFLVDVHVPEQTHIGGTDLFVPFDQVEQNIDRFPADKNKKIVVYCRSGNMSKESSAKLVDLGYKRVYNLEGGVAAWNAAGY